MNNRQLVINADDFGFSRGITDGIIHCHLNGALTSATLMTTMPDCDRAIELARSTPTLGVGIHLVLTQGTPRGRGLRGLLGRHNAFHPSGPRMLLRLARSRRARQELELEWSAQIEYALKHGLIPTHLDSHLHLHHFPACHAAVIKIARRFGIDYVRCAREFVVPEIGRLTFGYRMLMRYAQGLAKALEHADLKTSDFFFGLAATGRFDAPAWMTALQVLPDGLGEIMVHPGSPAGLTRTDTRLLKQRQLEGAALQDRSVAYAIQAANFMPTHYGRLASGR